MNDNYLEKLEYDKILEILSGFCRTYLGKKEALSLRPSNQAHEVRQSLSETEEAVSLLLKNSTPPLSEITDVTVSIKLLESYGVLSAKALLQLAHIFQMAEELKEYFSANYVDSDSFPILSSYFSDLYSNPSITDVILSSILDEHTLDDKASKSLHSIRKKQRNLVQDIKNKLANMLHSSSFSKYMQENVVTIRNDRYVIPIKEEYRSSVKGLIHDISSSGSTVFIEPMAVFELNNELNQLKMEESIEIEKILQDLTKLFYPFVTEIQTDMELIGKLDFIFAKARYSKSIDAHTPQINEEKKVVLNQAKHPLLDSKTAVPVTLTLGDEFQTLVITGPNTGGKTVTLKTVGLLSSMACSGLNIPAQPTSSICVFDHIFADIGDDQSIADSLSTFSSHMSSIVHILEHASSNSLVLVDELGSGTDPLEGGALAISILDTLKEKQILTIATTHYQELKKYALVTDGFENASVEFDLETLSPTYRLLVGIPGRSNAFEISHKLGLSSSIIEEAKSLLTSKDIHFEELLKSIHDDKSKIEQEKIETQKKLLQVSTLQKSLERDNQLLLEQEKEKIDSAKLEARRILFDAKEEASEILKEMRKIQEHAHSSDDVRDLNLLRDRLNQNVKNLSANSITTHIKQRESTLLKEDIKPNLEVWVTTLNQKGIVLSRVSRSNEVQVQVGAMKMNLPISVLAIIPNSQKEKNTSSISKSSYTSISKSRHAKMEVNVIGLNVEEATFVVDKFLDDSSLAKLQTVRIVHGKGTGKLRDGIHQFLKRHPHVKTFRIGTFGEGEMGVTVVELK